MTKSFGYYVNSIGSKNGFLFDSGFDLELVTELLLVGFPVLGYVNKRTIEKNEGMVFLQHETIATSYPFFFDSLGATVDDTVASAA
jgi:hypothetical protein